MMSKEYEVIHALRRSRMDIMENILRVTSEGAKKTHIMYKCNLSVKQLNAYLDLLVSIGLLKSVPPRTAEKRDSKTYETTEKGQVFVQGYRSLTNLLLFDHAT